MTSILLTLLISYILLFLYSLRIRDNSIVDVFWGFGFVLIATLSFLGSDQWLPQIAVTVLVILWWARIVSHIGIRKMRERKEDARYAKWREEWGSGWYFVIRSFLQVYMLQMILMLVVATAILVVNHPSLDSSFLRMTESGLLRISQWREQIFLIIGTLIALAGLIFETIADRQLASFLKIKKPGEIFTTWLYRYSRHPNYFGESMFWLGISLIALPFSYWWLVSFVVITVLLLWVSGVPLQEARYAGRANWEEYKARTSVFVPWFPKR
jgi:steroid 5-alpha reductase family enzyme